MEVYRKILEEIIKPEGFAASSLDKISGQPHQKLRDYLHEVEILDLTERDTLSSDTVDQLTDERSSTLFTH